MESTFYPLVVIIQYVPGYNFSDSVTITLKAFPDLPLHVTSPSSLGGDHQWCPVQSWLSCVTCQAGEEMSDVV